MIHDNSREAYNDIPLTERQAEVVKVLKQIGKATDEQIAGRLGYAINRVTGRITELREAGIVIEVGSTMGQFGKMVRISELKPPPIMDYKNKNQMRLF